MKHLCAFALVAATGWPAAAQVRELVPGRYVCSAPARHLAKRQVPALQPGPEVRIRLRFISDALDPEIPAAASVQFVGSRRGVIFRKVRWGDLFVVLYNGDHRETIDRYRPIRDAWLEVKMRMNSNGIIRVRSRGKSGVIDLGGAQISETVVQCQSGSFEIEVLPSSR